MVNRAPGRTNPNIVPGGRKSPMMSTRETPGSDPMFITSPNVDPGAGQQYGGPGFSQANFTADLYGSQPYLGINNMNDLYDYYSQYAGEGGAFEDMSFIDFINNQGFAGGSPFFDSPDDSIDIVDNSVIGTGQGVVFGGPQTGGAIGGAGDIGYGNMFAGGATGTGGFALNEPDTSIIDPSVDQQCLAAFQTYGEEYDSYEEFANAMC
jgi:hypothetical protein